MKAKTADTDLSKNMPYAHGADRKARAAAGQAPPGPLFCGFMARIPSCMKSCMPAVFLALAGGLFLPAPGFGSMRDFTETPSYTKAAEPDYILFFESRGGILQPKCRIHSEKHPGILPDFIYGEEAGHFMKAAGAAGGAEGSLPSREAFDECGPDLSYELAARAEGFSLSPQTALAPLAVAFGLAAINLTGCAAGAFLGVEGGSQLAREHELDKLAEGSAQSSEFPSSGGPRLPSRGELLAGAAPVAGGGLSGASSYVFLKAEQAKLNKISLSDAGYRKSVLRSFTGKAGAVGFLCGVFGGAVGYFF